MTETHEHARDSEPMLFVHRRASDAFIARWVRRIAYTMAASFLPAAAVVWKDRETKVNEMHANAAGLQLVSIRVDNLEKKVEDKFVANAEGQRQILAELRDLRGEVNEMYKRAIKAGGTP